MAPPTSVLSTTLQLLRDKLVDNSYLAHPLFRAIEQSGNLIRVSGGARVEQPVIFGDHSQLTELTNGFEPVSMAVTDPFQVAKFEYSTFTQPIILSAVEELATKGETAVVNILEAKMNNVMLALRKAVVYHPSEHNSARQVVLYFPDTFSPVRLHIEKHLGRELLRLQPYIFDY